MTTTSNLETSASLFISQYHHTPFYCEENVYLLCKKLCENGIADAEGSDLFVVFISNDKKQVPLWSQKASNRADGAVLWDYHVICVQRKRGGGFVPLVWDLDSSLPFPSPLASYISETIRPSFSLFSDYQRFFRIVHAPIFLHHFASDRRHMKDSAGNWSAEPPTYDPIIAKDGTVHNLNEYMEIHLSDVMKNVEVDSIIVVFSEKLGVVVGENQLEEFFSQIS
ncbi:Protein N-terminal glutamine amidohydrolase, alpha beta roll [Parasponia andersonii]|uniref:Protein N-terminal glutamine amidohydrolase n=1 Tax=Parasponia andersonii TaxID=3476 RepID=A0A2P5AQN3_PARAD|nr:Protein N-terminal glutamine amidohydrolase, alpha beta roll [Parasponia andersonii]